LRELNAKLLAEIAELRKENAELKDKNAEIPDLKGSLLRLSPKKGQDCRASKTGCGRE
jgi:hypothetical protein